MAQTTLPPSEHWRAGMALLARGDFELGWKLWETRPIEIGGRASGRPNLSIPEWDGERAISSLLILPEQGLGDQIMMARYASWLAARGLRTTLMCHPLLERLMGRLTGVEVISASGRVALPAVDAWALAMSMPHLCKTWSEAAIPPAPYLSAKSGGSGIGFFGSANPGSPTGAARTLPPDVIEEVLSWPGVRSLDPRDTGAADFEDTARIVDGLELVISTDTSVAHLAGAMGKPCYVLLPHTADWRWLKDRSDSPWYPTARLFRQPEPGDWRAVLDAVRAAVGAL